MGEKIDQIKGAVKEKAGQVAGDGDLEREGNVDQAKGKLKEALSDAKDAVKKLTD